MGKREEKGGKLFCAAALCAVLGAAGILCLFETLPALDEGGFSVAAAGFILPDGALAAVREGELFWETDSSVPDAGSSSPAPVSSALSDSSSSPLSSAPSAQSEAEQMQEAVAAGLFPENGPVETVLENGINETTISNTGIQYGNVWVKIRTNIMISTLRRSWKNSRT